MATPVVDIHADANPHTFTAPPPPPGSQLSAAAAADALKELLQGHELEQLVEEDEFVRDFFVELRGIPLGCCTLSPRGVFIIFLFVFSLPLLATMASVLLDAQLPAQLFFDGCRNGTHADSAKQLLQDALSVPDAAVSTYPYLECLRCNGDSPVVNTNSSAVSFTSQAGFALVIVLFNILITLVATSLFIRLSAKEFGLVFLLAFDVVVETGVTCFTIVILVVLLIMCLIASALAVAYSIFLNFSAGEIPLGVKPNATATFADCIHLPASYLASISSGNASAVPPPPHLYAVFNSHNPSLAGTVQTTDPWSVIKATLVALVVYLPIVFRLAVLIVKNYDSFSAADLMQRSHVSQHIFMELKYSVSYADLMHAVEDYVKRLEVVEECGCVSSVARFFSLHFSCTYAPREFIGFTFGRDNETINIIVNILYRRKQLGTFSAERFQEEKAKLIERSQKRKQLKQQKDEINEKVRSKHNANNTNNTNNNNTNSNDLAAPLVVPAVAGGGAAAVSASGGAHAATMVPLARPSAQPSATATTNPLGNNAVSQEMLEL